MENLLLQVYRRSSRRVYLNRPVAKEKVEVLKETIEKLNIEGGVSMVWIDDASDAFSGFKKSRGLFKNVRSAVLLKGGKKDAHLFEKLGYYGECIALTATAMDLGSCFVGGTFDKNSDVFSLKKEERMALVLTIGETGDRKRLRERAIHYFIHRREKSVEDLYLSYKTPPEWFLRGVKAAAKAPSAKGRQPAYFEYLSGEVRGFVSEKEWFDILDLGIAKYHFEIGAAGKFELGNGGLFLR